MPQPNLFRSKRLLILAPLFACAMLVHWAASRLGGMQDDSLSALPGAASRPLYPPVYHQNIHTGFHDPLTADNNLDEGVLPLISEDPLAVSAMAGSGATAHKKSSVPSLHTPENTADVLSHNLHNDMIKPAPLPHLDIAVESLGVLLTSQPDNVLAASTLRLRMAAFRAFLASSDELRAGWRAHLAAAKPRGILVPAGRATAVVNAFVMLHTLRHAVGCKLPVLIAHWGEAEVHPGTKSFFRKHIPDVEFMDLSALPYPAHQLPLNASGSSRRHFGYKLKVWALYNAPFREVVFLDADSTPLQDPETLFDLAPYKKHGSTFWGDFWSDPIVLWDALGLVGDPWEGESHAAYLDMVRRAEMEHTELTSEEMVALEKEEEAKREYENRHVVTEEEKARAHMDALNEAQHRMKRPLEAEAGQGVLDRSRHWQAIEWTLFLNTHDAFGDKDTFRAAFALAGAAIDYWQTPWAPALPLTDRGESTPADEARYWNLGMLQLHPVDGSPMFHHRTADSKFLPMTAAGSNSAPVTHVTPSVTQDQASLMIWGAPGYTLSHASGRVVWGLRQSSTVVMRCPNGVAGLHEAERVCAGRGRMEQEMHPEPVTVIEVPRESYLWKVSVAESEAYSLIPFQEEL